MRSDRLLAVLLLLQAHRRLSAGEIARRLEVSVRTVYRDIESLSQAGVPVYMERGRNGGCGIVDGYRVDASGLTADEARALFVVSGGETLADLGLATDLQSALRKLMTTLPDAQRPAARRARDRVVVEPRGWMRNRDEAPFLGTVQRAVWQEQQLRLSYRSSGSAVTRERLLDPYGLVAKGGAWYLIAAEAQVDGAEGGTAAAEVPEPRMYRVSRIEAAEVGDEPARRPADLDLERLWESMRDRVEERGPGVAVTLRVRAGRADLVRRMTRAQLTGPIERIDPLPFGEESPAELSQDPMPADDWITFRMPFVAVGAALGVLLGFGADVEVLGPPGVRSAMAKAAAEIVDLYGRAAISDDAAASASISTRASRSHATR